MCAGRAIPGHVCRNGFQIFAVRKNDDVTATRCGKGGKKILMKILRTTTRGGVSRNAR